MSGRSAGVILDALLLALKPWDRAVVSGPRCRASAGDRRGFSPRGGHVRLCAESRTMAEAAECGSGRRASWADDRIDRRSSMTSWPGSITACTCDCLSQWRRTIRSRSVALRARGSVFSGAVPKDGS